MIRPVLTERPELPAASEGPENAAFRIRGLTVSNLEGNALDAIPAGSFFASVSVTNTVSGLSPSILLASYTTEGKYCAMMFFTLEGTSGAAVKVTLPVDNEDGSIAKLKAFAVTSLNDFTPCSGEVVFPA